MRKMMKEILVFGSLLFLMSVSGAALAQNCTNPTRCDELGYTFSAEDCEGIRSLICPFDSSKYFCDDEDPAAGAVPGMILYSDRTVSNDVVSGKTAVGVVAYVDGSTRFAVALEETTAAWGGYGSNVSCLTYCNTYKPVSSGTGSNGWYLPAGGELYVMSFSYGAINLGLQKLSKTQLSSNWYWSSSEDNYNYSWLVRQPDGAMYNDGKIINYVRVRCVRAF